MLPVLADPDIRPLIIGEQAPCRAVLLADPNIGVSAHAICLHKRTPARDWCFSDRLLVGCRQMGAPLTVELDPARHFLHFIVNFPFSSQKAFLTKCVKYDRRSRSLSVGSSTLRLRVC